MKHAPASNAPRAGPKPKKCTTCGELGHTWSKCPLGRQQRHSVRLEATPMPYLKSPEWQRTHRDKVLYQLEQACADPICWAALAEPKVVDMNHPSHVVSINCPPNVDFGVVYVPEDENDDGDADGEDNAEEYYAEGDAEGYGYEEEEERDGDQDWSAEADTSWNASFADKSSKADLLQAAPHKGMEITGEAVGVVEKDEGNEEDNPAESAYLHEESGPVADHQTLADNTPAQEAAKSAKLTVVNDSAVPVLLVAVHCLPRVPQSEQQNHSDAMSSESATNDAGTTTVSNPNLFQAQLPPNGLLINPGHKEDIVVVCVAPCFSGGLAAGFQARWIVFEFEAEVTVAPPVGDQPVLGAVALHDLEVYTLQELKNILGPEGTAEATRAFNLAQDRAKARQALASSSSSSSSPPPALTAPTLQECCLKVAQEQARVAAASAALAGQFPSLSPQDANRKPTNVHEAARLASHRAAWGAHNSMQLPGHRSLLPGLSALNFAVHTVTQKFVVGRRCSVVLLSEATRGAAQPLSAEVTRFVPAHLLTVFDAPSSEILTVKSFEPPLVQNLLAALPFHTFPKSLAQVWQVVQDDAIEAARSAHKVAMASPTPSIAPPLPMTPPSLSLQSLPPGEQASSFPPLPSSPSSMPVGPAGAAAAARAAHAASLAAHGPGLEKAAQDAVRTLWFGSGWKGFGNKGSTSIGSTIGSEKSGANASSGSAAAAAAAHLLFLAGQLMLEECTMAADLNNHDLYHQALSPHLASFDGRGRRVRFPRAPPRPDSTDHHGSAEAASADYLDQVADYESEMAAVQSTIATEVATAVFRVPGANENRPHVRYGDEICLRLAADLHNNHSTTPSPPAAELRARVVSRREDEVTVQLPTLPKGGNLAPAMQPWAAIWRRTSSESTSDTSSGNFMGEGPKLRVHARLVLDRAALSLMHASLKDVYECCTAVDDEFDVSNQWPTLGGGTSANAGTAAAPTAVVPYRVARGRVLQRILFPHLCADLGGKPPERGSEASKVKEGGGGSGASGGTGSTSDKSSSSRSVDTTSKPVMSKTAARNARKKAAALSAKGNANLAAPKQALAAAAAAAAAAPLEAKTLAEKLDESGGLTGFSTTQSVLSLLFKHGLDDSALQLCAVHDLEEVGFSNVAAKELLALCGHSASMSAAATAAAEGEHNKAATAAAADVAAAPLASQLLLPHDCEPIEWAAFHPQLNQGQRNAVNAILSLEAAVYTAADETANAAAVAANSATKEVPKNEVVQPAFIVFGPPGTGKTLTVVEAVMQLLQRNKAPSRDKSGSNKEGATSPSSAALNSASYSTAAALESADGMPTAAPSPSQHRRSPTRILLCAPSEAAANILCLRLAELGVDATTMHRLAWWQVGLASLPPQLLKFVAAGDDGVLAPNCPPTSPYEVIVCTCAGAGQLRLFGWEPGSFSHIVVDESCQALEPEVLIPLSLVGPTTAVVLCGDPRQLGGAVRSGVARAAGLGLSLQERLMACMGSQQHDTSRSKGGSGSDSNTSNSGGGSGGTGSSTSSNGEGVGKASTSTGSTWHSSRWIAMLSANYRSHAALLDVPSQLFYSGQLEEHADPSLTHSLLKWEGLPGQHPMLFYGVRGREEAEIDSPSYFNLIEAEMVVDLVKQLLRSSKVAVSTSDIGIVAAFRVQVLRLRRLLRDRGYGNVNVGQVEDFQGNEHKVIIISTVVARKDFLKRRKGARSSSEGAASLTNGPNAKTIGALSTETNGLEDAPGYGLLLSPKRFNVALTRAQALCIVVGSPDVLIQDPCWNRVLEDCVSRNGWFGCGCPELGVGLNGTDPSDGTDADALLDHIASLSGSGLLGAGRVDEMYPSFGSGRAFSDDGEWRIML